MKSVFQKWRSDSQFQYGIYIGPSVLSCSRVIKKRGQYAVDDCAVTESWAGRHSSEWLIGLDVGMRALLRKCHVKNASVKVVFDDSLLRFMLVNQNAKLAQKEVQGLIDWHAAKNYSDSGDYAWSGGVHNADKGSVLYAEGVNSRLIHDLERIYKEHNLLWLHAGSAANLTWKTFDKVHKKTPGVLVRFGREGWTLSAWKEGGMLSLVKFGHWRAKYGRGSEGDDFVELRRLLTICTNELDGEGQVALHLDAGDHDPEWLSQHIHLLGSATAIQSIPLPSCATDELEPYAKELALATSRAYTK